MGGISIESSDNERIKPKQMDNYLVYTTENAVVRDRVVDVNYPT